MARGLTEENETKIIMSLDIMVLNGLEFYQEGKQIRHGKLIIFKLFVRVRMRKALQIERKVVFGKTTCSLLETWAIRTMLPT